MTNRRSGVVLFTTGVIAILVHTVLPFLWALVGIRTPYPLAAEEGALSVLPGFTPAIGALLMVIGGLVFGRQQEK